jgi:hypothetical protein
MEETKESLTSRYRHGVVCDLRWFGTQNMLRLCAARHIVCYIVTNVGTDEYIRKLIQVGGSEVLFEFDTRYRSFTGRPDSYRCNLGMKLKPTWDLWSQVKAAGTRI